MVDMLLEMERTLESRLARINVDQYHLMIATGILEEGAPIELLEGLLVYKDRSARGEPPMSIGKRHNAAVTMLISLAPLLRPLGYHVQIQGPITLSAHREPEPDGLVLRGGPRDYLDRLPARGDASCVIEISDSSLDEDRGPKLAIYASAGIPQYVIVNLVDSCIEVYEEPVLAEGRYAKTSRLDTQATLPLHVGDAPRLDVPVRDLLP